MDSWGSVGQILNREITTVGAKLVQEIPQEVGGGIHTTVSNELLFAIDSLPEMKACTGRMIWTGMGGQSLSAMTLGTALILKALDAGCDAALKALSEFFRNETVKYSEIFLLGGISVRQKIDIGLGMYLCPPEEVPIANFKKLHAESKKPMWHRESTRFDLTDKRVPGAALIRHQERPKLFDPAPLSEFKPDPQDVLSGTTVQLLTLIGPSSPTIYRQFCELDDCEFLKGSLATGYAFSNEETRVTSHTEVEADQFDGFDATVNAFLKLAEDVRTHLFVSIHRLNEAVKHRSEVDKALDLGIALESLLLSGKREKEQLALQFRLRGAWFLGRNGNERVQFYRTFQELYELRSMAAHTGTVALKKGNVSDALANGQRFCAQAITRVITEGGYPDWVALVVGAEYVVDEAR